MQPNISTDFFERFLLIEDPRVEGLLLMGSWWPTIFICIAYYLTIIVFTKYMRGRPAFEIRGLMIGYNVAMVLLSAYMLVSLIFYGIQSDFNLHCWRVSADIDSASTGLAFTFWLYFFSKILEFLDTMFFIARKKFHLVSLLHVYHHMIMPASTWLAVRYSPGGFITTHFGLNCLVHVFMYSYYALAAAGEGYQKYLWWKKYMTVLQIVQFIIIIGHCTYFLAIDCHYSKILVCVVYGNAFIFLFLFSNFFVTSYKEKDSHKKEK